MIESSECLSCNFRVYTIINSLRLTDQLCINNPTLLEPLLPSISQASSNPPYVLGTLFSPPPKKKKSRKEKFSTSHYDPQIQEVFFGFSMNRMIGYTEMVYCSCLQAITVASHYRTGMIQNFFCTCCYQAMQSHAPFAFLFYEPHQNQSLNTLLLDYAFKSLVIKLLHLLQI